MTKEELLQRYKRGERNFHSADLRGQSLRGQKLPKIDLTLADLRGTDFRNCNLQGAILTESLSGSTARWTLLQCLLAALLAAAAAWIPTFGGIGVVLFGMDFVLALPVNILILSYVVLWQVYRRGKELSWGRGTFIGVCALILLGLDKKDWIGRLAQASLVLVFEATAMLMVYLGSILLASTVLLLSWRIRRPALAVLAAVVGGILFILKFQVFDPPTPAICYIGSVGGLFSGIALALYRYRRFAPSCDKDDEVRDPVRKLAVLRGTCFAGAELQRANLSGALLDGASLAGANIARTNFRDAELDWAYFGNKTLDRPSIKALLTTRVAPSSVFDSEGPLRLCFLDLRDAELPSAVLSRADLRGTDLSGALLDRADLREARMQGALLQGTSLRRARLQRSHMENAQMAGALLVRADLNHANLREADLSAADLRGARLRGANLEETVLRNARIDVRTYQRSGWNETRLLDLVRREISIENLSVFPSEVREALRVDQHCLVLRFMEPLTPYARHLIEEKIYRALGPEAAFDFSERGVSCYAVRREDLELLADELDPHLWDPQAPREAVGDADPIELMELKLKDTRKTAWSADPQTGEVRLQRPARAVLCYAAADYPSAQMLTRCLHPLKDQKLLALWHEGMFTAGDDRTQAIQKNLDEADFILVLVSADALALGPHEAVNQAKEFAETKKVRLIPILVRDTVLDGTWLERFQPLPQEGGPLSKWDNIDAGWAHVTRAIRRTVLEWSRTGTTA